MVEGVTFHHRLSDYPSPSFSPALAVHAADAIYLQLFPDPQFQPPPPQLDYFKKSGLEGRFEHWQQPCQLLMEELQL